jgi:hypothetical protein
MVGPTFWFKLASFDAGLYQKVGPTIVLAQRVKIWLKARHV